MEKNGHIYFSGPPTIRLYHQRVRISEVSAAVLFAVVIKMALPVHHVGGPAMKLHLPLTLCLIYVV